MRQILYRGIAVTVKDDETDLQAVRRIEVSLQTKEASVSLPQPVQADPYAELNT